MEPVFKIKFCQKCYKHKPLTEFTIYRKSEDGRYYYCRECLKIIRQEQNQKRFQEREGVYNQAFE